MNWLVTSLVLTLFLLTPFAALSVDSSVKTSKTLTIAVIDTGIDANNPKLCKFGHRSFVDTSPNPLVDDHGHGTHIAGIIAENAGNKDYCLVSLKFYSDKNSSIQNAQNERAALQYAVNIKADFINLSGGGPEADEAERAIINKALDKKITLVMAAGNERHNLDTDCNYYPACYDKRIIMVGNLEVGMDYSNLDTTWRFLAVQAGMGNKLGTKETHQAASSNSGYRVTRWEIGTNVLSTLPGGRTGYMTGTSQATAVATGKLVKERLSK